MADRNQLIEPAVLEHLRSWLSNRCTPGDSADHYQARLVAQPSPELRHLALPDLQLSLFKAAMVRPACPPGPTKALAALHRLAELVRQNRKSLASLELLCNGYEFVAANFEAAECAQVLAYAATPLCSLEPAAGGHSSWSGSPSGGNSPEMNQEQTVLASSSEHVLLAADGPQLSLSELMARLCVWLMAGERPLVLTVKLANYGACLRAAFLLDLSLEAGFGQHQLQLFGLQTAKQQHLGPALLDANHNELPEQSSLDNADFLSATSGLLSAGAAPPAPSICVCLHPCDTYEAAAAILAHYVRSRARAPTMLVLVEECAYSRFVQDLEHHYSLAPAPIAHLVDIKCLDVRLALRRAGRCINVIRFRCLDELCGLGLLGQLRGSSSVGPVMQLWAHEQLLVRELTLASSPLSRISLECREFWLNHTPTSLAGRLMADQQLECCVYEARQAGDSVYARLIDQLGLEQILASLRRRQAAFVSKRVHSSTSDRCRWVMRAYLQLVTRYKSARAPGATVGESMAKLKRFQLASLESVRDTQSSTSQHQGAAHRGSRVELLLRPKGLAAVLVRDRNCVRHKSHLVELIFMNLLLGNGVLLVCPGDVLGRRFPHDLLRNYELPFQWLEGPELRASSPTKAHLQRAAHSGASLVGSECDSEFLSGHSDHSHLADGQRASTKPRRKCPRAVYALELSQPDELGGERAHSLVLALGARRRTLWQPASCSDWKQQLGSDEPDSSELDEPC